MLILHAFSPPLFSLPLTHTSHPENPLPTPPPPIRATLNKQQMSCMPVVTQRWQLSYSWMQGWQSRQRHWQVHRGGWSKAGWHMDCWSRGHGGLKLVEAGRKLLSCMYRYAESVCVAHVLERLVFVNVFEEHLLCVQVCVCVTMCVHVCIYPTTHQGWRSTSCSSHVR